MTTPSINSGVFNHVRHQAEIELIRAGTFKQFQIIPVPLDTAGIVKVGGGDQGSYEADGCGLMMLDHWMNNDGTILGGTLPNADLYVRFNHPDNPWLPINLAASAQGTGVILAPCSYALTIYRVWFYVPAAAVAAGVRVYFLLVRGVSIEAGGNSVAGTIATYNSPTLGGDSSSYSSPGNPWSGGSKAG